MADINQFDAFNEVMRRSDFIQLRVALTIAGSPVNITGWSEFWFTAKLAVGDGDAAAVFQKRLSTGGITVVDMVNGIIDVFIQPADTSGLDARRYRLYCDVQAKDSSSNIRTGPSGLLTVLPDVTISVA